MRAEPLFWRAPQHCPSGTTQQKLPQITTAVDNTQKEVMPMNNDYGHLRRLSSAEEHFLDQSVRMEGWQICTDLVLLSPSSSSPSPSGSAAKPEINLCYSNPTRLCKLELAGWPQWTLSDDTVGLTPRRLKPSANKVKLVGLCLNVRDNQILSLQRWLSEIRKSEHTALKQRPDELISSLLISSDFYWTWQHSTCQTGGAACVPPGGQAEGYSPSHSPLSR